MYILEFLLALLFVESMIIFYVFKKYKKLEKDYKTLSELETGPLTMCLMARAWDINERLFNNKQGEFILNDEDFETYKKLLFPPNTELKKHIKERGFLLFRGIKVIKKK